MKLHELKASLRARPASRVGCVLPDGATIPPDFHITEVGHVTKRFIDCGGTRRLTEACLLQAWVAADDKAHRLTAGKLLRILDLSAAILPGEGLDVELEHGEGPVSQYALERVETVGDELRLNFRNKQTDCLAREACGLELEPAATGCGCGEGKCC